MQLNPVISPADIAEIHDLIGSVAMDDKIGDYILNIIGATRNPEEHGIKDLAGYVQYGASPRATIFLGLAARAYAFLDGRAFVTPQDVKTVAPDVLRHRVILTYEAEAEDVKTEDVISRIFDSIQVP